MIIDMGSHYIRYFKRIAVENSNKISKHQQTPDSDITPPITI